MAGHALAAASLRPPRSRSRIHCLAALLAGGDTVVYAAWAGHGSSTGLKTALQQTSLNGPQDLRLITDVPVPAPAPGDVLIQVTAAGVNFGDISQAHGAFLGGPQPPYLAGFEAAGEIVARGEAVTGLEPGARVIGVGVGCGAFAEYTALPAVAVIPARRVSRAR